jgi:hypothetical protein
VKTLYAITHVGRKDKLRRLTLGNQGRNHYPTAAKAEDAMSAFQGPDGLCRVLDPQEFLSLEVRPVECYDHGDAVGIYFD